MAKVKTILVTDDEPLVRNIVGKVLRRSGYEVLLASNAHEALEFASSMQVSVDLLLTDVVMPNMSGKELAERFLEKRPHTKVVYMTGYADAEILSGLRTGPEAGFLPKAFTPRKLLSTLEALLGPGVEIEA